MSEFLEQVMPPHFRFGTGDIIGVNPDAAGVLWDYTQSGQIDIVVEYPFMPSLRPPSTGGPRLYFAGGVAAAIEVKSDLAAQWDEVVATATKLRAVQRGNLGTIMSIGKGPSAHVPLYVVAYKGWAKQETIQKKLIGTPIDGVLQLDPCIWVGAVEGKPPDFWIQGNLAHWALIAALAEQASALSSARPPILWAIMTSDSAEIYSAFLRHQGHDLSPEEIRRQRPQGFEEFHEGALRQGAELFEARKK